MAGMGGLGSALAGLANVYPGYKQGEISEFQLDDLQRQQLAKSAMGNALQLMAAGGQGGMGQQGGPPPGMPPGQPSQPMQPPPSPGGGPAGPGPGMPPRPAMPPGGMPGAPPGGPPAPPPMQRPGMVPGGAPAQGGPPGMQQPGMPQMGGPGAGQQGRQLDWRQLVQAVQQANPNIKPDVLAEAVNQFLPMMNAQSQQEWKQVSLQIREQALQERERQVMMLEAGRNQRADEASSDRRYAVDQRADTAAKGMVSRETIAKMTVDERREAHEAGLISKEQMDAANRQSRETIAGGRQEVQRQGIESRERVAGQAEAGRNQRAEMSSETRMAIAKLSDSAKREIAQQAEAGRMQRSADTLDTRKGIATESIDSREKLAQLSAQTRKEIAQLGAADKKALTEYLEAGRNQRAGASLDLREREYGTRREQGEQRLTEQDLARVGREKLGQQRLDQQQSQFDTRETRLESALELRADTTYQRLEQQKQQAMQRVQESQGKQGLAQARAIIDAQDKHVRTKIAAASSANTMSVKERKTLLDQADMDYNESVQRLKQAAASPPAPAAAGAATPAGPAPAGGPPAPPQPGAVIDGFRFKGGDPSKPESWEKVGA